MDNLIDYILSEVSVDERIIDGIFDMNNNIHMDVLFEYLTKHGIRINEATNIVNGMVEGKFPERQAYSIDSGRTTTFSSKEKRDAAIKAGTHTLKEPQKPTIKEPTEKPIHATSQADKKDADVIKGPVKEPNIFQNGHQLEIEPMGGKSVDIVDKKTTEPFQPNTPNELAATKAIFKQIVDGDNTTLSNLVPPLELKEELSILLKEASRLKLNRAVTFLIEYI